MKYLDSNPVFMESSDFLRSLQGKRLRWELPNDCTDWGGDLDALISVEEAPTGAIAIKLFGGILPMPQPYSVYLTPAAVALIQPDKSRYTRADFCAIALSQA